MLKTRILIGHPWFIFFCALVVLSYAGCLKGVPSGPEGPVSGKEPSLLLDFQGNLSGMWEYRQGEIAYDLLLDRHGNGTYDWQQGRFETTALSQDQWKGRWVQEGNDREGKFEARVGVDGISARGRWWYTRIGNDTDPIVPGGEFMLIRQGSRDGTSSGRLAF